jgi:hypothetical protein
LSFRFTFSPSTCRERWTPYDNKSVTFPACSCNRVRGPFRHGTRVQGDPPEFPSCVIIFQCVNNFQSL